MDEAASRYKGLRGGVMATVSDAHSSALLVKADVASWTEGSRGLQRARRPVALRSRPLISLERTPRCLKSISRGEVGAVEVAKPTRYHGTVVLDPAGVGRDASKIAEEVIAHLSRSRWRKCDRDA